MPISSFHGLRKNSIPTKPWNSTRSSPQRSSPTETRKRSIFGVPQLWTSNEFQDAFEDEQDIERYYNKCSGSPVVNHTPKSRGKTSRKPSLNSQPNSSRIKRVGLKRRETFPKFSGECSRRSEASKVLRRSQTDPTIFPADKKPRKDSYKPLKRPSLLWTVSKKEENSSTKFRRRKAATDSDCCNASEMIPNLDVLSAEKDRNHVLLTEINRGTKLQKVDSQTLIEEPKNSL